eukprot:1151399-Prorocentrum_minimum.AAC.5
MVGVWVKGIRLVSAGKKQPASSLPVCYLCIAPTGNQPTHRSNARCSYAGAQVCLSAGTPPARLRRWLVE